MERPVRSDPVAEQVSGFKHYRSSGQATAVRYAANAEPGSTTLVNLPTGSGKSLTFQVPFAVAAQKNRVSVLIVPTTALALDQEQRLNDIQGLSARAYHSGLSTEERSAIRRDFRNGIIHALVTSPESFLTSLAPSLYEVAGQGLLACVALDEAHMAASWGSDFRPEFQVLGGFVQQLRDAAPSERAKVSTLLLSATVNSGTRRRLKALFGDFAEASAISIRPEPEYWVAACGSKEQKFSRVVEAVRFLPRPVIIYTATRDEAKEVFERVRAECEVSRVRLVRGGDLAAQSSFEGTLSEFQRGKIDIVVATSAFGLGIDNQETRTVIHACIPETADRFYQEVGRAGRDGAPSVSLLLFGDYAEERRIAAKLSRVMAIGLDLGWKRWKAMKLHREIPDPSRPHEWSLSLDEVRIGLLGTNDANRLWNLRTLTLMQSAGILRLGVHLSHDSEGDPDAYERRVQVSMMKDVSNEERWRALVGEARASLVSDADEGLTAMNSLIAMDRPFNEIFADQYGASPEQRVSYSVGWDPVTRKGSRANDSMPLAPCGTVHTSSIKDPIEFGEHGRLFHFSEGKPEAISDLLVRLAARGVLDFELPRELYGPLLERELLSRVDFPVVRDVSSRPCRETGHELKSDLRLPGVTVVDSGTAPDTAKRIVRRRLKHLPWQIMLISDEIADPETPHIPLSATLKSISIDVLRQGN